jgi:hypothetical protein
VIDVGDVLPASVEIRDSAGVLADPGVLALTLTLPDGSTVAGGWTSVGGSTGALTIVRQAPGAFAAAYVTAAAGVHAARWQATGGLAAAYSDTWIVADPSGPPLCSLADLRAHLRKSSTASDEEVRRYGVVATELAEEWLGRAIRRRVIAEDHAAAAGGILLARLPVISVASVTADGVDITSSCVVDLRAGVVALPYGMYAGPVTVAYVAGQTGSLARYQQGVLEIARHLWDTQRGGSQLPRQQGAGDEWSGESGWSVPRRTMELLGRRIAGFA